MPVLKIWMILYGLLIAPMAMAGGLAPPVNGNGVATVTGVGVGQVRAAPQATGPSGPFGRAAIDPYPGINPDRHVDTQVQALADSYAPGVFNTGTFATGPVIVGVLGLLAIVAIMPATATE